jgi:hypothetical protein
MEFCSPDLDEKAAPRRCTGAETLDRCDAGVLPFRQMIVGKRKVEAEAGAFTINADVVA